MHIQKFEKRINQDKLSYIRASDGYLYGKCSRLWHFVNKYGIISFTNEELSAMAKGTKQHELLQTQFKDTLKYGEPEKLIFRWIKVNGQNIKLTAHIDYAIDNNFIEIKPDYDISAYIQILIQKLIEPKANFLVHVYKRFRKDRSNRPATFHVKADLNKAKIYIARILTALDYLTDIPPFHLRPYPKPCDNCIFKSKCYGENKINGISWQEFKVKSQEKLKVIQF